MRSFCTAKAPHIFSAKNGSVFVYSMFEIFNIILNNGAVGFEQLGPELLVLYLRNEMLFFRESLDMRCVIISGISKLEWTGKVSSP